jgi:transposase
MHLGVWQHLSGLGMSVAVHNPFRTRSYANGQGQTAKTDRLDARILAEIAAEEGLEVKPYPNEEICELKELRWARANLSRDRATLENRLKATAHKLVATQIKRQLSQLDRPIDALDQAIQDILQNSANLKRKAKILRSIPGLGPVSIAAILAELPEIETLSDKEIASLVGVAPMNHLVGRGVPTAPQSQPAVTAAHSAARPISKAAAKACATRQGRGLAQARYPRCNAHPEKPGMDAHPALTPITDAFGDQDLRGPGPRV